MSKRLLVITEELPSELRLAGADPVAKAAYYNPDGCFDSVALIDWGRGGDWPELSHPVLALPRDAALEAWLTAVQAADFAAPMHDELVAGWPGVPNSWLELIREFNPCAIRAYGVRWSGWLALQVGRALEVPVLCSAHNVIGLASRVLQDAPLIAAVSDEVARACIDCGADPARVVTVHNRVDRDLFTPDGPAADGPEGSPRLLSVARDVPQKNLDRLLQACAIARRQLPGLRLVHAGRSSRDWSAHDFALHFDALPNRDLPSWMRWADALILPSLWEGFGTVIVEALACGTPVITSNRGCMAEIVIDRWDGLHCDPEDAADIARAITELAVPGTRARLSAPARTASEPYALDAIGRREAALYRWLLEPERPGISVVIPTHNRAAFIERAVNGVLLQAYPALELVVVDDGSTDNTPEILRNLAARHGDRLHVIRQANTGLPGALNAGFAAAHGELLAWMADDDAYKPGALDALARELTLDPQTGGVFADYEWVSDGGLRQTIETGPVEELAQRNVVGLCVMFRREALQRAGGLDPDFQLAEDYELWVRMSRATRLSRLRRVLFEVTDHPGTLTNRNVAQVQEATMRVQHRHYGPPRDATAHAQQLARLASAYKQQRMVGRSLATAWRLMRHAPASGLRAMVRALTPGLLLRLTRRLRGLKTGDA